MRNSRTFRGFFSKLLISSCHFLLWFPTYIRRAGLRYEDILNESQFEVQEALDLASPDVVIGRTRRLKRAIDLGFKRKNLQDYAPNMKQDTFKTELYDDVVKVRSRDQEYALLNAYNK